MRSLLHERAGVPAVCTVDPSDQGSIAMPCSHLQPQPSLTAGTIHRRKLVSQAAMLAGGATLAAYLPGIPWTRVASAQDDTITLTASAAEVSASPGSAVARSAVAEAAATRGAARVLAAAALASADSDGFAIARGAAASAAADPAQGAIAQGATATANAASAAEDRAAAAPAPQRPAEFVVRRAAAPAGRGGARTRGRRVRGGPSVGGGRRAASAGRARASRGGGRERQRNRVGRVPSAGIGSEQSQGLAGLFAAASGIAGVAAMMLRNREPVGDSAGAASVLLADRDAEGT
jgi:hypothetical protein